MATEGQQPTQGGSDIDPSRSYLERSQKMLIHGKMESSAVNGPGNRAVIWLQGCSLDCRNCWNPETHDFNAKNEVSIGDIQDWITNLKDIEGITFSGGEPMQQAQYLYVLLAWIRKARPELTIGMYTGYTKKELEHGKFKWKSAYNAEWIHGSEELWKSIRELLDFAITGRYVDTMACHDEALRGSRNQEVLFFTGKYTEDSLSSQVAEVTISDDALVQITGYPTVEFLDANRGPKVVNKSIHAGPATCTQDDDSNDDLVGV